MRALEKLHLILASGSPRRTELLNTAGLDHVVIVSGADEDVQETDPRALVEALSARKAAEVYDRILSEPELLLNSERAMQQGTPMSQGSSMNSKMIRDPEDFAVLGADTVVAMDGVILGKPHDEEDARRMLRMLSGRSHHVCTGVTLHGRTGLKERICTFSEESTVHVDTLTDEEIDAYIATGEPMDKAGAYGIQGAFMKFVTHIEGDYFNIVGLPVSRVYRELKKYCAEDLNSFK